MIGKSRDSGKTVRLVLTFIAALVLGVWSARSVSCKLGSNNFISAKVLEERTKTFGDGYWTYNLKLEIEDKVYYATVPHCNLATDWAVCPGDTIMMASSDLLAAKGSSVLALDAGIIVAPKSYALLPEPDPSLWSYPLDVVPGPVKEPAPHKAPLRAGAIDLPAPL